MPASCPRPCGRDRDHRPRPDTEAASVLRPRRRGQGPARQDDARREDRPDDAGRAAPARRRERRRDLLPRLAPLGRRLRPQDQQPAGLDGPVRPAAGARAQDAAQDPASSTASTPCTATTTCWAPSSSRTTSAWAPRATRRWSRRSAASPRKEVRATGIQWTFAPCVAVVARRALGPHLRGLLRGPGAGGRAGRGRGARPAGRRPRRTRCACWPAPSTSWATAARPTARARCRRGRARQAAPARPGRHAARARPSCSALHLPGYLTAIAAGVGSIMPSYNSWNGEKLLGQQAPADRHPEGRAGFEGFLISDYNAIDAAARRLPRATSSSRSTRAWTW